MSAGNVEVTVVESADHAGRHVAVVTDRHTRRAWSADGASQSEATTKAVRQFLGDRRAREYVG